LTLTTTSKEHPMAKKQTELAGTRRPDEPVPQQPIKALDEACEELVRARGQATRKAQAVVAAKKKCLELLVENGLVYYEYEDNDVLKKLYRKESAATCKVKVAKKADEDDDGADE
jgi:hypothetical protein